MASILVIDDQEQVRTFLRFALERNGHTILEAKDGREGLETYRTTPTDLVIMDIIMPDTDGLEATYVLTRDFPGAKIIAITGQQGNRNFLDVAKLFGAHGTLEKPFTIDQLLEAVTEAQKETAPSPNPTPKSST